MATSLLRKLPMLQGLPATGRPAPRTRPTPPPGTGLLVEALLPDAEAPGGDELLQVGDLAKASGKTVRAIHHYEEVGLLRPSARSKGRFRLYDGGAVTRVRWIGKLHDLGMSLAEIQAVLSSWEASPSAPGAMARIRAVYAEKLEETRAQIARLRELERELEASLEYLDTCDRCDPAELIAACSSCQNRDASDLAPELVAGISGCSCAAPSATSQAFPEAE